MDVCVRRVAAKQIHGYVLDIRRSACASIGGRRPGGWAAVRRSAESGACDAMCACLGDANARIVAENVTLSHEGVYAVLLHVAQVIIMMNVHPVHPACIQERPFWLNGDPVHLFLVERGPRSPFFG